ncbi:hypothetical protein HPP92_014413 [Vanilla planifolia]|uniref:Purple acid phosphatase n=1 Tax=Vanilla planifolia TaxID=51239 RepID=A0A835UUR0_VANPL|nr:hypothetical protein HPP92_014413 [Vanilla planifolia]
MTTTDVHVFFLLLCLFSPKVAAHGRIPTTLDGPFAPRTRRFDPSLRLGSDDVPMDDPKLAKKVGFNFPEQIALAISFSHTSMWVSWVTGDAQIGKNVMPLDPSTVGSEVWYGEESGKYSFVQNGTAMVYNQLYPFEGLLNYTSGIIHHVRLDGLKPGTRYYYKCGDSSLKAMSKEHTFETFPTSPDHFLRKIAVVGDLGLTLNSTSTIDHLSKNDPSLILMVGDLSYANQYLTTGGKGVPCYGCAFPDAPIRETYQPRWDGWGRFMEPLTSKIPMMVIEGNHEIEPQARGINFSSYLTRFAVPSLESHSESNFYYSFNAGGIHFIMLGAYIDYNQTGAQYAWLKKDLLKVDRELPPGLWQLGILLGDGGNIEQIDIEHADDPGKCPSKNPSIPEFGGICHLNFSSGPAKGKFCWDQQPEWSAFRESSFGHGILENCTGDKFDICLVDLAS